MLEENVQNILTLFLGIIAFVVYPLLGMLDRLVVIFFILKSNIYEGGKYVC